MQLMRTIKSIFGRSPLLQDSQSRPVCLSVCLQVCHPYLCVIRQTFFNISSENGSGQKKIKMVEPLNVLHSF